MKKTLCWVAICVCVAAIDTPSAAARGFGGARGGGGSRGGMGGGSHNRGMGGASRGGMGGGQAGARGAGGANRGSGRQTGPGGRQGLAGPGQAGNAREGSLNGGGAAGRYGAAGYHAGAAYGADGYHAGGAAYGAAGYRGYGAAGYGAVGYRGAYGAVGYGVAGVGGLAAGAYALGGSAALPTDAGFAAAADGGGATNAQGAVAAATGGDAGRGAFDHPGMFNQAWYGAHPGAWKAAGWTAARPWTVATWPQVGAVFGWDANVQPIAYNYGTDITYQNDQVYNGDQPVATAEEYYQQAADLVQSAPAADPQGGDWLPLGTFGLVHREGSDPHYVMQLEINKAGVVAGNYCDMLTDHNLPVHGAVDPKTQRLAWSVGKNQKVVGEVGLYNLTQDEAPALLHVGSEKTQQWLLVRLEQPAPTDGQ